MCKNQRDSETLLLETSVKLDVNVVQTAHVSLFGHGEGVASVKMS